MQSLKVRETLIVVLPLLFVQALALEDALFLRPTLAWVPHKAQRFQALDSVHREAASRRRRHHSLLAILHALRVHPGATNTNRIENSMTKCERASPLKTQFFVSRRQHKQTYSSGCRLGTLQSPRVRLYSRNRSNMAFHCSSVLSLGRFFCDDEQSPAASLLPLWLLGSRCRFVGAAARSGGTVAVFSPDCSSCCTVEAKSAFLCCCCSLVARPLLVHFNSRSVIMSFRPLFCMQDCVLLLLACPSIG